MNIINKLFNKPKVECPRCLGKGHVDENDIKRLKKELIWVPGQCTYCNGNGKVSTEIISKIDIDNSYLTTDITQEERKRLINQDKGAIKRAELHINRTESFIKQVEYLNTIGKMNAEEITEFYLLPETGFERTQEYMDELKDYIIKIIDEKNKN